MPNSEQQQDNVGTNGTPNSSDKSSDRKDVCRDFLNNICNRGSRCKFFHPEGEDSRKSQNAAEEPYQFCIDFQNQGCHRDNCRYVHAFREDVDRYKRTGDVTLGLARALAALMRGDTINGIPICKEFQNGHCARGSQCRYWHINRDEERRKRFSGRSGGTPPPQAPAMPPPPFGIRRRADEYGGGGGYGDDFGPSAKRGAFSQAPTPMNAGLPPAPATRVIVDLERRNAELVSEVDSLKRELQREKERYDDLMALFRATQTNQAAAAAVQQQRPNPIVQTNPLSAVPTGNMQQTIPGLGSLPQPQQQWQGTAQQNWGKYEWNAS